MDKPSFGIPPPGASPGHVHRVKAALPADTESIALIRNALKVCPLMNRWPDSVLHELAAASRLGRYGKQSALTQESWSSREAIVVVSGRLMVVGLDTAGARFVLALHGPGEILGLVRMLDHIRFLYDFQVAQDTVLVHLPAAALIAVLDAHPVLWRDVSMLALSRLHDVIARQQRRALGDTDSHLADMLLRLAANIGKPMAGGSQLSLALSQTDLAGMMAMSRQTVNKALRVLHDAGVVQVAYGRIDILDFQALRQRAG